MVTHILHYILFITRNIKVMAFFLATFKGNETLKPAMSHDKKKQLHNKFTSSD